MTGSGSKAGAGSRPLAIFDFDGTITYIDTLPLALLLIPRPGHALRMCLPVAWTLLQGIIGRTSRTKAKERAYGLMVRGMAADEFLARCERFSRIVPLLVRRKAVDRMRWHRRRGHEVVIVSASLGAYIKPWAREFRAEVLATRIRASRGVMVGTFDRGNVIGRTKVRRLEERYGPLRKRTTYVYGDTAEDLHMMRGATHAYYRWKERDPSR